jgi:hypothetical protein
MADENQKREHGIPVGGVILLFLGVVFLLQTLNVIPWGLWGTLWRFWPALLVIIGLGIILRRYNPWLQSLLVLVVLFACLGLTIWQHEPSSPVKGTLTQSYIQPRDNLESATIRMDLSVGDLSLAALPAGSPNLVEAGYNEEKRGVSMKADFSREGAAGVLNLRLDRAEWHSWDDDEFRWQARFTRDISLTMDIKSAVSNLEVDLNALKVTELKMKLDVGNYKVVLPASVNDGRVDIKAALSNTEVTVPAGVAARIKVRADLSSVDVDQSRFPKQGDYYVSSDFDSAKNRIDIDIESDLGRVAIK